MVVRNLANSLLLPDYETKVPADVRRANKEKLDTSEVEIVRLAEAVAALASIE